MFSRHHKLASTPYVPHIARCLHGGLRAFSADVPLTPSRYTHLRRGNYGKLVDSDIAFFRDIIGPRAITDAFDVSGFCTDWLKKYHGQGSVVLLPKTVDEVSKIMAYCNSKRLAVVPQGGNTGLVGGSVPVFDEVVLSTKLMNQVRSFDEVSGILSCDAGCVLESLDGFLASRGHIMPLDLGAKGSCHIGGNVATNAGGIRFMRYGSLHGSVLGLEAVLADGRVVDTISPCRKDNTGYDLKQLFIGSEGTLGVITGLSIAAPRRSKAVNVTLLGCDTYAQVCSLLAGAKAHLGEILSAVEFLDALSMESVQRVGRVSPLTAAHPFYVLLETSGSSQDHDSAKLEAYLDLVMGEGLCNDGVVAQDTAQGQAIWGIREGVTESLLHDGYVYKYDVSLPTPHMYALVEAMRARCGSAVARVCGYGHVADGNLHLNVTAKEYSKEVEALIEPFVYEYTANHNGSISAEHGLGLMKAHCIHYSKSPQAVDMMRSIKTLFDPNGILNPYKTIPVEV